MKTPKEYAQENLIFDCISGSKSYGMSTPTSDEDRRGLFMAEPIDVIAPFTNMDQVEGLFGSDSVHYELRKFISLVVKQNPNIVELLWVEPQFIKESRFAYEYLREARGSLLSKNVYHTYTGYAYSQLQRIKGHNKWINNPQPTRRPKEVDYVSTVHNFTDNKEWNSRPPIFGSAYHLGSGLYGLNTKDIQTQASWIDVHEAIYPAETEKPHNLYFDIIFKFNKQLYSEAVDNWQHYWDWKKNRNEARSELEAKHGYDTKHGAHLIRLLRMGKEILLEGEVKVLRPDASELLEIRNGALTYDELLSLAAKTKEEVEEAYKKTKLPGAVDMEMVKGLITDLYMDHWGYIDIP